DALPIWVTLRPMKDSPSLRRCTMPMMALSVVDLPAPLRPIKATTSPLPTSKETPCRICAAPYQASNARTSNSAPVVRKPTEAAGPTGKSACSACTPNRSGRDMLRSSRTRRCQFGVRSEVHLAHLGVLPDKRRISLRDQFAACKHDNAVRVVKHDIHAVFREQDTHIPRAADLLDQSNQSITLARAHACCRFVHEEELWFARQAHGQLQALRVTIG